MRFSISRYKLVIDKVLKGNSCPVLHSRNWFLSCPVLSWALIFHSCPVFLFSWHSMCSKNYLFKKIKWKYNQWMHIQYKSKLDLIKSNSFTFCELSLERWSVSIRPAALKFLSLERLVAGIDSKRIANR